MTNITASLMINAPVSLVCSPLVTISSAGYVLSDNSYIVMTIVVVIACAFSLHVALLSTGMKYS